MPHTSGQSSLWQRYRTGLPRPHCRVGIFVWNSPAGLRKIRDHMLAEPRCGQRYQLVMCPARPKAGSRAKPGPI
jgi:hypothetical protein